MNNQELINNCPQCGSTRDSICCMETGPFKIIIEQVETELVISVPVERCQDCGFQWTDHRAEKIRDQVMAIYYPDHPELKALSAPMDDEVQEVIDYLYDIYGDPGRGQIVERLARENKKRDQTMLAYEARIIELKQRIADLEAVMLTAQNMAKIADREKERAEKAERQLEEYKSDAESYRELIQFMQESIRKDTRITDGNKPTAAEMLKIIGGTRIRGME